MYQIIVCAILVLNAFSLAAGGQDPERPNFIIILCDDLGYGDLASYGHPHIQTPNLDRMAMEGMRLTDCYSAAPVCSPSRAGLLTGRIPNRVGVFDWIPPNTDLHLPSDEITIATLLRDAGYDTCMVGKWHLNGRFNDGGAPTPDDHGFSYWMGTSNNARPSHKNPNNFIRNGQSVGVIEGYACEIVVDEAVHWLRDVRDQDRPFLQYICLHEPHEPVASPDDLVARYRGVARNENEAVYFANIENIDRAVGRFMSTLRELELDGSTLVFFTSDNGPETLNRYRGAGRSYGSPGHLRGMKLHLYEGGIRVPGILKWAGTIEPGQVVGQPVSGIDVLPTLCELAGVDVPADRVIDGGSFAAMLRGGDVEREQPLFWTYFRAIGGAHAVLRNGDWKVVAHWDQSMRPASGRMSADDTAALRTGRLTAFELYNLVEDLEEKRDRSVDEGGRLNQLSSTLQRLYESVREEAVGSAGG